MYEDLEDDNFVLIAAAQDSGGEAAAGQWYDAAKATYVTLVDEQHAISSLFDLVNVPSAVWIDEDGFVRRIDEGSYATVHKMGEFEFGRADYAPLLKAWVETGAHVKPVAEFAATLSVRSPEVALADPTFKLGVHFQQQGDDAKANHYWERAQALNPDSWNYHRQDWSFTPEEAGANWQKKAQALDGKPYYAPIEGLDP